MNKLSKIILFFALLALVPISVYLFARNRGLPPNFGDQGCSYLKKVTNLRDLLTQLMSSTDNDCLQKYSTKDLEAIWGINIPEIGANNFYSNGSHFADEQIKPYHDALNKAYKNPNDAYVLTKVHEGGNQEDAYYIQANHDFLKQYKGLNQWIPAKFDKSGWCDSRLEFEGDFVYQEPKLLDGFIEPLRSYWTCQRYSGKSTQKVAISIYPLGMENNYVTVLNIRIDKP